LLFIFILSWYVSMTSPYNRYLLCYISLKEGFVFHTIKQIHHIFVPVPSLHFQHLMLWSFFYVQLVESWLFILWLVAGRWFSPAPISSTNKTDLHNITEILLKVALSTLTLFGFFYFCGIVDHHCLIFLFKILVDGSSQFYTFWSNLIPGGFGGVWKGFVQFLLTHS
jgi:hypothetical protein